MLKRFYPALYIRSIYELPIEELKKAGIKALVFDIDNTVAPYDMPEADESMTDLFHTLKKEGFRLCLLSNNNKKRVHLFNEKLGALAVYKAGKPGIGKLKKAMEKMGTDENSTAMIGDQLFTDIYCGNRAHMLTILTAPVCDRDQFVTWIKRGVEKLVLKKYLKRSGQNEYKERLY